ncbi:MAG TPA: heme o synthase [Burkholderiaceae bacterium]|nr:heme o synthase [Burkholderiaceae bacterium]
MAAAIKQFADLFKLRIGFVISFTALAGVAVTPGALPAWKILVLGLAVLVSSASAGAFNQYVERDIDACMRRTRRRPFVTGELKHGPFWLGVIVAMLAISVCAAAAALNFLSALYVFLGAFVYAVVYTVWLKRRTWLNIVVGGLAGSFAVLAGAAAVSPDPDPRALILATVLFLWTPPHFWSLAIAHRNDYDAARVPMLPVVVGDARAARVICASTIVLVATSLLPLWYGMGWWYLLGAVAGGAVFLAKSVKLARHPSRLTAFACFHASLLQLSLLLSAAMLDAFW